MAALLILFVICAVASVLDDRTLDGENVWAKPLKFQLSLAVHFATLAFVVGKLGTAWRASPLLGAVAMIAVGATAFEMIYIMVQAGRGQASHFNLGNAFYAAMYITMAIGAVIIVFAATFVGSVAALDQTSHFSPPERASLAIGLIGGSVLTLFVAFKMGGRLSHQVGGGDLAQHMMLTGWLLNAGDLRVPHFFATHMMQAIPACGLLAARFLPASLAEAIVACVAIGWSWLTAATYQQALAGKPFLAGLWL